MDLLGDRVAIQDPGFAPRMADGLAPRKIEDESMVGLDLLIAADARKHHLGSASKTGEVVVTHGADCDQTTAFYGARVQTHGRSRAQLTDAHKFGGTAVVLYDPDRRRKRANQRGDGILPDRGMGAVDVDQGRPLEWLIEGGAGHPPCIAAGWSTGGERADTKTAEVKSQVVIGKREFDNHAVTIPSW
jgi:hypothetical protein